MEEVIMDSKVRCIILMGLACIFMLMSTSCTRYQGTSTRILEDLGVNYEITRNIPHYPNADAVYVEDEDKIYVKKGKQQIYLVLHEVVHKIRSNSGMSLGLGSPETHKLEEAIAVRAAIGICKAAGISSGVSKYQIPALISRTWKVNNLDRTPLTKEQQEVVTVEVEKSIELFIKVLKEKGHNIKEIDWVRTAILILI